MSNQRFPKASELGTVSVGTLHLPIRRPGSMPVAVDYHCVRVTWSHLDEWCEGRAEAVQAGQSVGVQQPLHHEAVEYGDQYCG